MKWSLVESTLLGKETGDWKPEPQQVSLKRDVSTGIFVFVLVIQV
jgi:hypothetical protein